MSQKPFSQPARPLIPSRIRSLVDDRLGVGHRRFRYLLVVPAALVLFMVTIFPFFYTLNISLRYVVSRNLRGDWPWIGLENYRQVLSDSVTWETTARTVEFVAIVVTVEMVLGFLLALFLVTEFPGARATRTLLLAPMMVTPIVVGLMWKALFKLDGGMVNHLLGLVGIAPVPWLTGQPIPLINALPVIGPWLVSNLNANYGFLTIVLIDVWQWTPFVTLVLVSGLYALPVEVLESALVDGAGYWQTVRRIVLPLLKPAILVVVLLRAMDALKVFETVWALFGNAAAYRLINVHIVTLTLRIRNYGQGAAISVVVLIIVLILSRYLTRAFLGRELRT